MAGNFPIRTPPFDAKGNWSRPLINFFNSLATSSSGSGSSGPVVSVDNVANTFTPDLTQGDFQKVVMVADSTLIAPTGTPTDGTKTWTLIVDNPTANQLILTPDSSYFIGFVIAVAANTRTQITWTNDENDHNSVQASSANNPIPA